MQGWVDLGDGYIPKYFTRHRRSSILEITELYVAGNRTPVTASCESDVLTNRSGLRVSLLETVYVGPWQNQWHAAVCLCNTQRENGMWSRQSYSTWTGAFNCQLSGRFGHGGWYDGTSFLSAFCRSCDIFSSVSAVWSAIVVDYDSEDAICQMSSVINTDTPVTFTYIPYFIEAALAGASTLRYLVAGAD